MAEIVLRGSAFDPADVRAVVADFRAEGERNLLLHLDADPFATPAGALLAELAEAPFRLRISLPDYPLVADAVRRILALGIRDVEIEATDEAALHRLHGLGIGPLSVFVPIPSPDAPVLAMAPLPGGGAIQTATLGVGWEHRLSGPTRLDPEPGALARWGEPLLALASALARGGAELHFACGLPLCLFPRRQLGALAAMRVRWPIAHCESAPVVDAAGNVRFCHRLPLARPWNVLRDGPFAESWANASRKYLFMRQLCPLSEAPVCRSLATQGCGGLCPASAGSGWSGM